MLFKWSFVRMFSQKKYFIVVIFLLFFRSEFALSSPTEGASCNDKDIQSQLKSMGLNPRIKENKELLKKIKKRYGRNVSRYLEKRHPALKDNPVGIIDAETVKWVQQSIWSAKHTHTRFILFPSKELNLEIMHTFVYSATYFLINFNERKQLVFNTQEQMNYFYHILKTDELIEPYIKLSLPVDSSTPDEIKKRRTALREYFRGKKNLLIGFSKIQIEEPAIEIIGHGSFDSPNLFFGEQKEHSISPQELVDVIKSYNIPLDSRLYLSSCYSGCSTEKLELTKTEIKTLHLSNELNTHLKTKGATLLNIFAELFYAQQTDFKGHIFGYLGQVSNGVREHVVFSKELGYISDNAVSLMAIDGEIFIKRSEMEIEKTNTSQYTQEI